MERTFSQYPSPPPPFIVSFLRSYMDWKSLLHHNVSHSFDVSEWMKCYVSTRSEVIRISSGAKPNSGVTIVAILFLVSYITNSCFGIMTCRTHSIEALSVTVLLQWALRTNQLLPLVTTQWSSAVCPISNQWVQKVIVKRCLKKN